MTNRPPQFEQDDSLGTSDQYAGTVGVAPVSIPSVAGGVIAHLFIKNPLKTPPYSKVLHFSLDGGTTWHDLGAGEFILWPTRSGLTQFQIKGSVASTPYEILLNRENP